MKKIIRGRQYDTEKAKLIGSWDNGRGYNDFDFVTESLYQKRTGEYFIAGSGGAASKYAQIDGNMMAAGSRIVPLNFDEAKSWAESHLSADAYEPAFGTPDEGDETRYFNCGLPAPIMRLLKDAAAKEDQSMGDIVARLVVEKYGK